MVVDVGAVLISAIMAGAVAIAATLVIERWGGALGSLVAIPTTIVPAAIGIWHGSSSVEAHANAMSMVPIGMLLNILFLGAWRVLPPRLEHRWSGGSLVTLVGGSLSLTRYILTPRYFISSFLGTRPTE